MRGPSAEEGRGRAPVPEPVTAGEAAAEDAGRGWLAAARSALLRFQALLRPRPARAARAARSRPWIDAIQQESRSNRRSLVLLIRLLSLEQRQQFRAHGYFHVTGGKTQARYRIRADRVANIDVLDEDGSVMYRLCVAPTGVPVYDVMGAQMLHLQDPLTEEQLLQKANVFYRVCSRPSLMA